MHNMHNMHMGEPQSRFIKGLSIIDFMIREIKFIEQNINILKTFRRLPSVKMQSLHSVCSHQRLMQISS